MENNKILLACDLNRTVLPDGVESLSEGTLRKFEEFAGRRNVILAYVSGMNINKSRLLVDKYHAPIPDFFVCDVGTTMYKKNESNYDFYQKWRDRIGDEWSGEDNFQVIRLLDDIKDIKLQPVEDQGKFKISYYIAEDNSDNKVKEKIKKDWMI